MSNPGAGSNPGSSTRSVWGSVQGGGAISQVGSGDWAVTLTATGTYQVTFNKPFTSVPCVSVDTATAALPTVAKAVSVMDGSETVNGFTVFTTSANGATSNLKFHFIATGT